MEDMLAALEAKGGGGGGGRRRFTLGFGAGGSAKLHLFAARGKDDPAAASLRFNT